jgi:hypothetical protein
MTTTLLTADAPAAPSVALAQRPLRATSSTLIGGTVLGVLSALIFDGGAFGLGFTLVTAAFSAFLLAVSGREGRESARGHRWLVASAIVLSSFVAVRDSDLLIVLDVIAVVSLLLLAVRGWNGERPVRDVTLGALASSAVSTMGHGVATGAGAVAEELRQSRVAERWSRLVKPLAKIGLFGFPLIGAVTLLLASGDAAFGQHVEALANGLFDLPVPAFARMVLVGAWMGVSSIGLVTWARRRRSLTNEPSQTAPTLRLGLPEALATLAGLTIVLVLFSVVSARCAFAPDTCSLPEGVTYSSSARQGFWQLLAVAAIVLMTVLGVPHRTQIEGRFGVRAIKVGATALVMATLPMLLSAVNRMMLYEDAYGFTRQRLFSQVICVFVALLLIWRAITVWTSPRRFAVGVVGSSVLVLTAFNVMNPDALIARKNIEREGQLDAWYLAELSADAASVLRSIPADRLTPYHASLFAQRRAAPSSFSSFNLARACDRIVTPLESTLCP